LVIAPRGAFIVGVFAGELREPDGTLIGTGSRRATVPAELEWDHDGLRPVVRAMQLDLMGFTIEVEPFVIEPAIAFKRAQTGDRLRSSRARHKARVVTP